jgi:hypothetical protein
MRYLLDVNALIALAYTGHTFHAQARGWFISAAANVLFRGFVEWKINFGSKSQI